MIRFFSATLFICLLAAGCSKREPAPEASDDSVGVLMFGDSGYHLDYSGRRDDGGFSSVEAFEKSEWTTWLKDKRPEEEFQVKPSAISPVTGKVVAATGLHQISAAMRNYCANYATCDLGVMVGDNVYPNGATLGTDGVEDAQRFKDILSDPFGDIVEEPSDYITYVTLGNHDWKTSREGGFLQIEYLQAADNFYADGAYYTVKPPAANGLVELFIIDTSMILASVPVLRASLNDDGSEGVTDTLAKPNYYVEPLTDAERDMPSWLDDALRSSTAKWKFVVAHHPIWSSAGSKYEQGRALRELLLPSMCRYADGLIVGHEHSLEIHIDSCAAALGEATEVPLVQIVSGAASKQRPVNTKFMWHQERKYPEHKTIWAEGLVWGFAHMQIEGDIARVTILSVPDDGSSEVSTDFEYEFSRRSHLGNGG
jgi:tartrate-resistant acid phosphatase type 5